MARSLRSLALLSITFLAVTCLACSGAFAQESTDTTTSTSIATTTDSTTTATTSTTKPSTSTSTSATTEPVTTTTISPTTTATATTTTKAPSTTPTGEPKYAAITITKPIPFEILPQATSGIRKNYNAKISDRIESTAEGGYRFEAYFYTSEVRNQFVDDATQNKVQYVKSAEKKGGDDDNNDDDNNDGGKPSGDGDGNKKTAIIIGASVGGVVALTAIIAFVVYQKRAYDLRNGNAYTQV